MHVSAGDRAEEEWAAGFEQTFTFCWQIMCL